MSSTLSLSTIPRGMSIEIKQTHTASYADMDYSEAKTFSLFIPYTYIYSQSPLVVSQQRISTQKLPQSHTSNVKHKVFNSHDPIFSNYEPSTVVSHLELTGNDSKTSFSLSYKPLI
jgi:hypothetical protein